MTSSTIHLHEGSTIPDVHIACGLQDPEDLAPVGDAPDARLFLTGEEDQVIAQAALWWRDTPVRDGTQIATIGGFDALDESSAATLLAAATRHLASLGFHTVVGPMNGNTWRRHRFVVESDGTSPFLLEPRNPTPHPLWWQAAGFTRLASYSSSSMPLDGGSTVPSGLKDRLLRSGVVIRPLNPDRYDDELRAIYAISLRSFASNFLYTPLEEDSFLSAYRKVQERVDPDLVRIAERDGQACGFVFAIPDLEAAARGEKPSVIVKTLAVDPAARCAGLGSLLVDEIHQLARAKGFTEAIHALQHETNTSLKITGRHHGHMIRRYALFSQGL
jgi:GNAT superfamily N-acetyltransferase